MESFWLILLFITSVIILGSNGSSFFNGSHLIPSFKHTERTWIPMVIDPVSQLTSHGTFSHKVQIQNVNWWLRAGKWKINGMDFLYIDLYVDENDIRGKKKRVDCIFRIISRGGEANQMYPREIRQITFSNDRLHGGVPDFRIWTEFMNEKWHYVFHDMSFLEAEVTVTSM